MASFTQVKVPYGHGFLGRTMVRQGLDAHPLTMTERSLPRAMSIRCSSSSYPVPGGGVSLVVSASHLHTSTPWLMLTPETDPATGRKVDRFYSMTDRQIFKLDRKNSLGVPEDSWCFGSSRGWIGFIDPNDCSLYLSNPFIDALCVHPLPSIDTLPHVIGVKRKPSSNSIDKFIMDDHGDHSESDYHYMDTELLSTYIVKHVSLSCDPFYYEDLEGQDCIAMINFHGKYGELAFCRVGREDTWTNLIGDPSYDPQIACHSKSGAMKTFYTMYSNMYSCGIDAWEIPKPWRIPARLANFMYKTRHGLKLHEEFKFETSECKLRNRCISKKYLVADESFGDIMLVIRYTAPHVAEDGTIFDRDPANEQLYKHDWDGSIIEVDPYTVIPRPMPYKTLRFDVYKVDMRKQKLKRIQHIGDRAIFLGLNQSFTLSACEFPGLRPNSIYFTDDCTEYIWLKSNTYGGHDLGIYNLEENSIEPCYPFPDDLKKDMKIKPPLIWVAPNCSAANSCQSKNV